MLVRPPRACSISALSYAFWILYLCGHPDYAAARDFYEQVRPAAAAAPAPAAAVPPPVARACGAARCTSQAPACRWQLATG